MESATARAVRAPGAVGSQLQSTRRGMRVLRRTAMKRATQGANSAAWDADLRRAEKSEQKERGNEQGRRRIDCKAWVQCHDENASKPHHDGVQDGYNSEIEVIASELAQHLTTIREFAEEVHQHPVTVVLDAQFRQQTRNERAAQKLPHGRLNAYELSVERIRATPGQRPRRPSAFGTPLPASPGPSPP